MTVLYMTVTVLYVTATVKRLVAAALVRRKRLVPHVLRFTNDLGAN